MEFEYENEVISFNVIRRKRKTMCIRIEEGGIITVIVPLKIKDEHILSAVKNKASWIKVKQKEILKASNNIINREAIEGSTFMYLGKEHQIHFMYDRNRKNIKVEFINEKCSDVLANKLFIDKSTYESKNKFYNKAELNNKFLIYTNTFEQASIKIALEKWYRAETLKIVTQRIEYYSDKFNDKVTNIKVKEQKRRWASCTGKNAILFNWRCSMARMDVLDYIVVHEMCHMDYRNHSKLFWNRVEEIMPDYREKHEWLKINGMNLSL